MQVETSHQEIKNKMLESFKVTSDMLQVQQWPVKSQGKMRSQKCIYVDIHMYMHTHTHTGSKLAYSNCIP
jgi:hypothetical protein